MLSNTDYNKFSDMFDVLKLTLNFICQYFGFAFMLSLVFFGNQGYGAPNNDDNDGDGPENVDDGPDNDGNGPDNAESEDDFAEEAMQIFGEGDEQPNDSEDTWSDSSSIERAFQEVSLMSQVKSYWLDFL